MPAVSSAIEKHLNGAKKGYFQTGCVIVIVILLCLIALELLTYLLK